MSERLFGTDGVRGRAGITAARPADGPTSGRRARARAAARRRTRTACSSGGTPASRASGSGANWRTAQRTRAASSTSAGVISTPAVAYLTREGALRRGRRHLGLAQPVRGQRHQGLLGRRREVHRAARTGNRAGGGRPVLDGGRRRRAGARATTDFAGRTWTTPGAALPARTPWAGCAWRSTAPTAPPCALAPRLLAELGFDVEPIGCSPDGRNINLGVRVHASRAAGRDRRRSADAGWASRSTATATARSSWTTGAASSTATRSCCWPRGTCRRPGG